MVGICQLCKKEKQLIGRSHVWPNFMYRGMHDDKGRLYVINSEHPDRHSKVQSGAYQQHIFCAECDNNKLGSLERYASNHLFRKDFFQNNDDFKQILVDVKMEVIHCEKLDYKQFKLFLLSLLWRASISKEALFENFKLTDDQEEFLRQAIDRSVVVDESVFPCVLLTASGIDPEENFIAIDPFRDGIVKFYINNFTYTYYLTANCKDQTITKLAIAMDHKMGILKVPIDSWNQIRQSIIQATVRLSKK